MEETVSSRKEHTNWLSKTSMSTITFTKRELSVEKYHVKTSVYYHKKIYVIKGEKDNVTGREKGGNFR